MHKKLLTLAIGAAMAAAPFVTAQAAPTVYGHAHVSIDSLDDDTGLDDDSNISQSSNSSRIGFKGKEAVGNGLSAFYQMEWQVGVGGTKDLGSRRNQFAGLKGSFGSILVGRRDTPMKDLGKSVDLFWRTQAGENRNITAQGGFDARLGNLIMYSTPVVNGLGAIFMYSVDGTGGVQDDNDFDNFSASATYKNGPIYVGVGYEVSNISSAAATAANAMDDTAAWRLVGSYKMNNWKFVGFWQSITDENFGSTLLAGDEDRDTWGLGAAYKMGSTTFKGQYYVADDLDNDTATTDSGAQMISVGVDHSLSANTTIYAVYAQTDNEVAGLYTVVGGGHDDNANNPPGAGAGDNADPSVFSVGMRIKF